MSGNHQVHLCARLATLATPEHLLAVERVVERLEQAERDSTRRISPCERLYHPDQGNALEQAYRRGWNDATSTLEGFLARLLWDVHRERVERGLAELRDAPAIAIRVR
ncbi:MAG: hypothetical protein ACTHU0_10120 [Kofleriaceae bacterium]